MSRTIERSYLHPTETLASAKNVSRMCKVLSTHAHRFCVQEGCDCECHNGYNAKNYTKNSLRRVRRIG